MATQESGDVASREPLPLRPDREAVEAHQPFWQEGPRFLSVL